MAETRSRWTRGRVIESLRAELVEQAVRAATHAVDPAPPSGRVIAGSERAVEAVRDASRARVTGRLLQARADRSRTAQALLKRSTPYRK